MSNVPVTGYGQPVMWGSAANAWAQTTNVVWQDTTSNATYCSAASVLPTNS